MSIKLKSLRKRDLIKSGRYSSRSLTFAMVGAMALALTACNEDVEQRSDGVVIQPPSNFSTNEAAPYSTDGSTTNSVIYARPATYPPSLLYGRGYYPIYNYPGYYYHPAPGYSGYSSDSRFTPGRIVTTSSYGGGGEESEGGEHSSTSRGGFGGEGGEGGHGGFGGGE